MPYIRVEDRKKFDKVLENFPTMVNKGELEYVVFKLMTIWMKQEHREHRYSILHDVVYAVQHCADEFRRRFLDKRETQARKNNGDIV